MYDNDAKNNLSNFTLCLVGTANSALCSFLGNVGISTEFVYIRGGVTLLFLKCSDFVLPTLRSICILCNAGLQGSPSAN